MYLPPSSFNLAHQFGCLCTSTVCAKITVCTVYELYIVWRDIGAATRSHKFNGTTSSLRTSYDTDLQVTICALTVDHIKLPIPTHEKTHDFRDNRDNALCTRNKSLGGPRAPFYSRSKWVGATLGAGCIPCKKRRRR